MTGPHKPVNNTVVAAPRSGGLGAKPPGRGCGGRPPQQTRNDAPCSRFPRTGGAQVNFGGVLLSHTLTSAVPSALEGLASGFGMGPGVSPPLTPPKHYEDHHHTQPDRDISPNTGRAGWFLQNHTVDAKRLCKQALGLLVPVNSTPHRASISGLSTPSSIGGLTLSRR